MKETADRVVLLEVPGDAAAYLAECRHMGTDPSAPLVVSLEPKVHTFLKLNGVRCSDSLLYFNAESHERGLRKSDELMSWLNDRTSIEDSLGISEAYRNAVLWYSRYFCHYLIWLAEVISEVHSQHPEAIIQTVSGKVCKSAGPRLGSEDRYLGLLAESFCRKMGAQYQSIDIPHRTNLSQRCKNISWPQRLVYKLGAHFHRSALRRMAKARPVLTPTHSNRMDNLVDQVRSEFPAIPWLVFGSNNGSLSRRDLLRKAARAVIPGMTEPESVRYAGEIWYQVLERAADEDRSFVRQLNWCLDQIAMSSDRDGTLFTHRHVDFGSIYAAKLRQGILPEVRKLHREIKAMDQVLDLVRPRAVVTPIGRRSLHALGELATRRGIPGLLISHGSFTPLKSDLEAIAWKFHAHGLFQGSYSHAALQTPLAESFSKEVDSTAEFVKSGPLAWGIQCPRDVAQTLKAKMLGRYQDCNVLVHAGTGKPRGSLHFHVYETMDEYVTAMAELVMAVNRVPDTFLIIKFRPNRDLGLEDLRTLLPASDRYLISVEESFLDVLGFSDLLVSFSSTTIEEALQNRVPVLMYGGEGRYQHIAAQTVTPDKVVEPAAVYSVRKVEHLSDAITRILARNGRAPLAEELFSPYVYRIEDYVPFPILVKGLVEK